TAEPVPLVGENWATTGAQSEPANWHTAMVGAWVASKLPVVLGLATMGGRKKKCGLPPLWAPSRISKVGAAGRTAVGAFARSAQLMSARLAAAVATIGI